MQLVLRVAFDCPWFSIATVMLLSLNFPHQVLRPLINLSFLIKDGINERTYSPGFGS